MAMAEIHYRRVREYFDERYSRQQGISAPAGIAGAALGCLRGLEPRGNALEIGCGDGANVRVLAESGLFRAVHGIDISAIGILKAASSPGSEDTQRIVHLRQGNAIHYTAVHQPYSLILINSVFEYMLDPDKQRLVARMMQNTAPGGFNAIGMVSSLPGDFLDQRLWHTDRDVRYGRAMFDPDAKARSLEFESGLADMYRKAGWRVQAHTRYGSERNFVAVEAEILIAQKRP